MADYPYMPWYVGDDLSDPRYMVMTTEQFGAAMRLRGAIWRAEGDGLPDDDDTLAILSGLGARWHQGASAVVRKILIAHPSKPGHLTTESDAREWQKAVALKARCAEGGRKSADAKRKQRGKGASSPYPSQRQAPTQGRTNTSPSPSPSPLPPHTPPSDVQDPWSVVVVGVIQAGISNAGSVRDAARSSGWTPEAARGLIDWWLRHRETEGWGAGLLRAKLTAPALDLPPDQILTLRTSAPVKPAASPPIDSATLDRRRAELLQRHGPTLDVMTSEERLELLADTPDARRLAAANEPRWRSCRQSSDLMLSAIEQLQTAETAA